MKLKLPMLILVILFFPISAMACMVQEPIRDAKDDVVAVPKVSALPAKEIVAEQAPHKKQPVWRSPTQEVSSARECGVLCADAYVKDRDENAYQSCSQNCYMQSSAK